MVKAEKEDKKVKTRVKRVENDKMGQNFSDINLGFASRSTHCDT